MDVIDAEMFQRTSCPAKIGVIGAEHPSLVGLTLTCAHTNAHSRMRFENLAEVADLLAQLSHMAILAYGETAVRAACDQAQMRIRHATTD
jgi:hypothetical protein